MHFFFNLSDVVSKTVQVRMSVVAKRELLVPPKSGYKSHKCLSAWLARRSLPDTGVDLPVYVARGRQNGMCQRKSMNQLDTHL